MIPGHSRCVFLTLFMLFYSHAQATANMTTAASGVATVYVAAEGFGLGDGSAARPFVLVAGREYELNRLVRPLLDGKRPTHVVFKDGVYHDVRLQIIREGTDTQAIYLLPFNGKPSPAPATASCNTQGGNCRVVAADFTMSATSATPLELSAEHEGHAIFDGARSRDARPDVESEGLLISGATFGSPASNPYGIRSERITNVSVRGLSFRNYRNGIHIHYATHIGVFNCTITSIGNRQARRSGRDKFGTSAISVDGSSYLVLLKDNTIRDIWNSRGEPTFAAAPADPSLIHGVYDGFSHDVVFLHNFIGYSSGPLIKWGFYPLVRADVDYQYPSKIADRRNFFINNTLVLGPVGPERVGLMRFEYQAFVHENSREAVSGKSSSPASGIVFQNNCFVNSYPVDMHVPVALLREELPLPGDAIEFPGWDFFQNKLVNVPSDALLVVRQRGTPLSQDAFHHDGAEEEIVDRLALRHQSQDPDPCQSFDVKHIRDLVQSSLRSSDAHEDALVVSVIQHGEMISGPN